MRWIGNEYSNELESVYGFNRMKNWQDFERRQARLLPLARTLYMPIKKGILDSDCCGYSDKGGEGIFIVPGDTSEYDWTGLVPFEELPYSYNPESGYVASANNRTVGDDYPIISVVGLISPTVLNGSWKG